jgi:hypothetical protein
MRLFAAAVVVLLMIVECVGAQQTPLAAIARARAATLVALETVDAATVPPLEIARRVSQAAQDFDRALAEAAPLLTEAARTQALANEATSIDAKLVVLADDRRRRPAVYEEIFQAYVRAQPRPTQSGRAPLPADVHVVETYRLAWEFFLLSPRPENTLPAFERGAADAVARIGNPRSASTLEHMVRVATQDQARPVDATERQRLALGALAGIPGPRGAAAIANVLDLIDARRQRATVAASDWDPVDFLAKRIDALPQPKRAAWLPALRSVEARPSMQRLVKELQTRLR